MTVRDLPIAASPVTAEGARRMCQSIDLHPSMACPQIWDRETKEIVPQCP